MLTRICIVCKTEKLVKAFINNSGVCGLCIAKSEDSATSSTKVNEENVQWFSLYKKLKAEERLNSLSKEDAVMILMDVLKNPEVAFSENILVLEYSEWSKEQFHAEFRKNELIDIIEELIFEESPKENPQIEKTVVDIQELLSYYSEQKNQLDKKEIPEAYWKKSIPNYIKNHLPGWKTATIEDIYKVTNEHLSSTTGELRKELFDFSCEISEVLFDVTEVETNANSLLKAEESITFNVESILIPYLEVLDKIEEFDGNILFIPENENPLDETLKQKVLLRDEEKCIICTNNKQLQIHYKIPLDVGGINVLENLVCVCEACKVAVETLDLEIAINKCLINYKNLHSWVH